MACWHAPWPTWHSQSECRITPDPHAGHVHAWVLQSRASRRKQPLSDVIDHLNPRPSILRNPAWFIRQRHQKSADLIPTNPGRWRRRKWIMDRRQLRGRDSPENSSRCASASDAEPRPGTAVSRMTIPPCLVGFCHQRSAEQRAA